MVLDPIRAKIEGHDSQSDWCHQFLDVSIVEWLQNESLKGFIVASDADNDDDCPKDKVRVYLQETVGFFG